MLRFAVAAGVAAIAIYLIAWNGLEFMRARHGPWSFEFSRRSPDELALTVNQSSLGIEGFEIVVDGVDGIEEFEGSETVVFDGVASSLPVGSVRYHDLMILPGVITIELYGNEIEFLPRTLYVNREEVAWTQEKPVRLAPRLDDPIEAITSEE